MKTTTVNEGAERTIMIMTTIKTMMMNEHENDDNEQSRR